MLKDITIGQYYPGDSLIHRLDPRTKLLLTILYIACVFLCHHPITLLVLIILPFAAGALAKLPLPMLIKGIRGIWILVVLTFVCNLFQTNAGGNLLWQFHALKITDLGLHHAIFYSLRLILLVLGASIMTLTTSPTKLTDGMETGLSFLTRLHVPVHEFAMMMSIALRFIPILTEEMFRIEKAQKARGMDFEKGKVMERVKKKFAIIIPLFVAAFTRADDLAKAMDARCYRGGEGRTKLHPLEMKRADVIAIIIGLAVLAAFIALRIVLS